MLKPLDYHKLQIRLLKKARRNIFPLKAMFEVTYRCNLRCQHCYVVAPVESRISTDCNGLARINQCQSVKISANQCNKKFTAVSERKELNEGESRISTDCNGLARIERHGLARIERHGLARINQCNKKFIAVSERKELNTKEVFIILEQLAAAGCLNIGFTGGEPFLRKDIFDILEYAKRLGFNIIVLTNATLITPKKADRLKNIGLNKIDVSFHAINEKSFDWFTQAPGAYTKVLKAVKLLRKRGIEVYLKITAMTINKDALVKIRHFAVERFGTHFRWSPTVTPRWDGEKDNLRFRLSPEEINQLMKQIQDDTEIEFEKLDTLEKKNRRKPKNRKRRSKKINHNRLFRCGAGRTEVIINPYGEMRLCMDIPEPKYQILKGSFSDGWEMLSDYVKRASPGPSYRCRGCELAQYCNFCPALGWLECGDMSACPPYYREAARLAKMEAENK